MKSLIVDRHSPLAEGTGSAMRTMNFARALARHGTVDLACHFDENEKPYPNIFGELIPLPRPRSTSVLQSLGRGIANRAPFPVPEFDEAATREFIASIAQRRYDVVLFRYVYTGPFLTRFASRSEAICIIDVDDDISGSIYDDLITGATSTALPVLNVNRRLLREYERSLVRRFPALVCSAADRERLLRLGARNTHVVPNTVRPIITTNPPGDSRENALLFVGTLSYSPNSNGLLWFLRSVFPAFRAQRSDATLTVVGRSPTDAVVAACEAAPGVTLVADAPDLEPYYAQSSAVVVPLLAGGGTRVKILEAALYDRPVLSTPIGAEGLDMVPGTHLLLFNDGDDFVRAYRQLDSTDDYERIVSAARAQVSAAYGPRAFETAFDSVLESCGLAPAIDDGREALEGAETTVVIPLFNKAGTIARTLASVLEQTRPPSRIIVVDDGSTDGGAEIVESIAGDLSGPNRPDIQLHRQPNAGPGAARNRGLALTTTPFVAFLDADDTWDPGLLESCLDVLQDPENREIGLVATEYRRTYGERSLDVRAASHLVGKSRVNTQTKTESIIARAMHIALPFGVMRTDVARRNGGYFEEDRCLFGEDLYFCVRILFNEPVYIVNAVLGTYNCDASELQVLGDGPPPPPQPLFFASHRLREGVPVALRPKFDDFVSEVAAMYSASYSLLGDAPSARALLRNHPSARLSKRIARAQALAAAAPMLPAVRAARKRIIGGSR